MGSVGDCYDNALCESFSPRSKLIERRRFANRRRRVFRSMTTRDAGTQRWATSQPVNFEVKHSEAA